jgi:hypothetical protein
MAKPLSPKSKAIRKALTTHPHKGNTALAEFLNDSQDRLDDRFTFTAQDVANQRTQLKKTGVPSEEAPVAKAEPAPEPAAPVSTPAPKAVVVSEPAHDMTRNGSPKKKPGRKPGPKPAKIAPKTAPVQARKGAADVIDHVFAVAKQAGGLVELKRIVDTVMAVQHG